MSSRATLVCALWAGLSPSGCVEPRCFGDADCPAPRICGTDGRCVFRCTDDTHCGPGFRCVGHLCEPIGAGSVTCPPEMVAVDGTFCLDRYEASRVDATATTPGWDESAARSVAGVLPWRVASNGRAAQACAAAGKRLCTEAEWEHACRGPGDGAYAYGDTYDACACNGLETHEGGTFRLEPTGALPECTNEWGAYDLSGNVWEHVAGGDDTLVRGGAFNCSDPPVMLRCTYVPRTWTPSARGFRCCLTPGGGPGGPAADAGPVPDADAGGVEDAGDAGSGGGCLDEDAARPADPPDVDGQRPAGPVDAGTDVSDVGEDCGTAEDDGGADACDMGEDSGPGAPDGGDAGDDPPEDCPPDMADLGMFCIDRYEASHRNAHDIFAGDSPVAASRPGVLPWVTPVLLADTARAACVAAGKRLCTPDEWSVACAGRSATAYAYGDAYDPTACNGIDTYCRCDVPACRELSECPYPHCHSRESAEGGGPCGAGFHLMFTGSFPECANEHGMYDLNGNVWELVESLDGALQFRGGAYNCADSELLHRCDYVPDWIPTAQGFRCCRDH